MQISEALAQRTQDRPENVVSCQPGDTVRTAIATMTRTGIGAVMVSGSDGVVGIFSERDVLVGIDRQGCDFLEAKLGDTMSSNVIVLTPDRSIDEAIDLMREHRFRHLPIVEDDQIVAVLSIRDLISHKLSRVKTQAEFLKQQVQISDKPLPM